MTFGNRLMIRFLATLFIVSLGLAAPVGAQDNSYPAETWTEPYKGKLNQFPPCETQSIQALIARRFASTRDEYWGEPREIVSISNVRQVGFRPEGLSYIPRLYCEGTALTNDGVQRRIVYSIIEEGGMSGIGFGVNWCVVGLDPSYAYAPACRAAMP